MSIIDNILNEAEKRNLSDQDLCKILNTHKSKIYDWKKGRSEPSAQNILVLAQYFNVTTDYLLTGREAKIEDKSEPTVEEILQKEGIRDDEDMKALLRVVEMMKKKSYNAELGDEFIVKESGTN